MLSRKASSPDPPIHLHGNGRESEAYLLRIMRSRDTDLLRCVGRASEWFALEMALYSFTLVGLHWSMQSYARCVIAARVVCTGIVLAGFCIVLTSIVCQQHASLLELSDQV